MCGGEKRPVFNGPYGFYDSVNITSGQIGHRYLVLDQAMIFAALDNVLRDNQMQNHNDNFAIESM